MKAEGKEREREKLLMEKKVYCMFVYVKETNSNFY